MYTLAALIGTLALLGPAAADPAPDRNRLPLERLDDPYVAVSLADRRTSPAGQVLFGGSPFVQVNVDGNGNNIVGDAANEPSIAVDPTNPLRMVAGWRQFDTITSNFRQAGVGYTNDGGQTWTFPGVIDPTVFRSDPVVEVDSGGSFIYYSLELDLTTDTYRSADGGASWGADVYSFGGDKAWIAVDRRGTTGDGHLYAFWSAGLGCCLDDQFNRSVDAGLSFEAPIEMADQPAWGTIDIGPNGEVWVAGIDAGSLISVSRSTTIVNPLAPLGFDFTTQIDLNGTLQVATGPNPGGLLGQVWIAIDESDGGQNGWVYVLASVDPPGADPLDVHFMRSEDNGATWSTPVRLNDDPAGNGAWQWFATMSVAPNGRIDVIWNDTREDPGGFDSRLTFTSSDDGGTTWATNTVLSPPFDPHVGWPQQDKIGDYYDMVSANDAAHLIFSATFNGEQDVYYLRIPNDTIFSDGFASGDTSGGSASVP